MKQILQNRGYVGQVGSPFVELDRDKVAKRLRLDDRGRENGELGIPAPDASILDYVETEIVTEISNHAARAQIEATGELSTYSTRITQLDKLAQISTLPGTARAAIGDLKAALNGWNDIIFPLRTEVEESFAELQSFRQTHSIKRPAHSASPAAATWGALLVAWAVEVAANTAFLRVNDDLGLIGGAVAAALVASVNLFVLGALGGISWRQLQHRATWRRGIGLAGITVWMAGVLIWNVFAAHYRDAKSAMHPSADTEAIRLTFSQPFAFDGILSIGFLAVGVVFSAFAAQRFYKMDDPYPGYGDVWRRHQSRREGYSAEVSAAREDLQVIRDKAVQKAASLRSDLSQQLAQLAQIKTGRGAFLRNYAVHLERLEQDGNTLLEHYRLANRRVRKVLVPPHFDMRWELVRTNPAEDFPLPPMPVDLEEQVSAAQRDLEKAITDINDAFDAAECQFVPLSALEQKLTNG